MDLEIKLVAAGQVWIDAHGPTFLKRLQDVVATRPGDVRPGWPGRPQPGWSIQARRLLEAATSLQPLPTHSMNEHYRFQVPFHGRLRNVRDGSAAWRRVRLLLLPLAVLGLGACGGGTLADDLPPPLSASQAAQMLTASPKSYPAALAVRVTTTSADVQVRGVQRVGGAALRGDEAFPMGSVTKSMTATLAGVLVQEGRISWTSRIVDVLPELASLTRSQYAAVTLKDLLAHRGGLFPATTPEQIAQLPALTGTPTEQRLQLAAWMLQRASSSQPGVKTQYSNGDYIVAGAMLERAAGQPYESLLQAKVFAPMGGTVTSRRNPATRSRHIPAS
ncbi:MAG: hypothetical protein Fur0019_19480 [Tibeticola sp.]